MLSGYNLRVVYIRSLVLFDIPGQRKSSPVCTKGVGPGINVVTVEMIVDLDRPKERRYPSYHALREKLH